MDRVVDTDILLAIVITLGAWWMLHRAAARRRRIAASESRYRELLESDKYRVKGRFDN